MRVCEYQSMLVRIHELILVRVCKCDSKLMATSASALAFDSAAAFALAVCASLALRSVTAFAAALISMWFNFSACTRVYSIMY